MTQPLQPAQAQPRLQREQQRLYLLPADPAADPASPGALADAAGQVRALVLELAAPADWDALGAVWQAVQTECDLPAPGIAVSGVDGLQLWFSLAQPLPAAQGRAFLQALVARHLASIRPHRIRLLPADADADGQPAQAALVPAVQPASGHWSAFVSAELAPMFADGPWLDTEPGADAQASLLARLQSIAPPAWRRACVQLGLGDLAGPADTPARGAGRPGAPGAAAAAAGGVSGQPAPSPSGAMPTATAPPAEAATDAATDAATETATETATEAATSARAARAFLLAVVNDPAAPLALRIDAAKALLAQGG